MAVTQLADPLFLRLFGSLDFVKDASHLQLPAPPPLQWKRLPRVDHHPEYDEDVRPVSDWEQPLPLGLQILFEPEPNGCYDVQWVAPEGSELGPGDPLARCYRTSDGLVFQQTAPVRLRVHEVLTPRNRRVIAGDALMRATVPGAALDLEAVKSLVDERTADLAQAVNAMVKGFMGFIGESGQVTDTVVPIAVELEPTAGYDALIEQVVEGLASTNLVDGDIVVLSEKVVAQAQGRVFPVELLLSNDPKTVNSDRRADLLEQVAPHIPGVTEADLLMADVLTTEGEGAMATAGVLDANAVARDLSAALSSSRGVCCDAVISDTDTGLDVREQLIGCWTIGATPVGATAGLVIYECMRVANAAEFARGSHRRTPIVLCKPHPRRAKRDGTGQHRGYPGRLDAHRERLIGFA